MVVTQNPRTTRVQTDPIATRIELTEEQRKQLGSISSSSAGCNYSISSSPSPFACSSSKVIQASELYKRSSHGSYPSLRPITKSTPSLTPKKAENVVLTPPIKSSSSVIGYLPSSITIRRTRSPPYGVNVNSPTVKSSPGTFTSLKRPTIKRTISDRNDNHTNEQSHVKIPFMRHDANTHIQNGRTPLIHSSKNNISGGNGPRSNLSIQTQHNLKTSPKKAHLRGKNDVNISLHSTKTSNNLNDSILHMNGKFENPTSPEMKHSIRDQNDVYDPLGVIPQSSVKLRRRSSSVDETMQPFRDSLKTPPNMSLPTTPREPRELAGNDNQLLGGGSPVTLSDTSRFSAPELKEFLRMMKEANEAKTNRKMLDLEISNKSLMSINKSLEARSRKQAYEINLLKERLVNNEPLDANLLEQLSSLSEEATCVDEDGDEGTLSDPDELEFQQDPRFRRVCVIMETLIRDGKNALENQVEITQGRNRVLMADEIDTDESEKEDETSLSIVKEEKVK